jgi:hypothetical protein
MRNPIKAVVSAFRIPKKRPAKKPRAHGAPESEPLPELPDGGDDEMAVLRARKKR